MDPLLWEIFKDQIQGSYDKKGNPNPLSILDQGRQGNYTQDLLQMLFNPQLGMMSGGLDYMQMVPQESASEPPPTPYTQAWQGSGSAVQQEAVRLIAEGQPKEVVRNIIRQAELGEDETKDLIGGVDSLWDERQAVASFKPPTPEQSPIEKMYRDAGLPSPLEQYTKESFRPDLPELEDKRAGLEQAYKSAIERHRAAGSQPLMNNPGVEYSGPGMLERFAEEGVNQARDVGVGMQTHGPVGAVAQVAGKVGREAKKLPGFYGALTDRLFGGGDGEAAVSALPQGGMSIPQGGGGTRSPTLGGLPSEGGGISEEMLAEFADKLRGGPRPAREPFEGREILDGYNPGLDWSGSPPTPPPREPFEGREILDRRYNPGLDWSGSPPREPFEGREIRDGYNPGLDWGGVFGPEQADAARRSVEGDFAGRFPDPVGPTRAGSAQAGQTLPPTTVGAGESSAFADFIRNMDGRQQKSIDAAGKARQKAAGAVGRAAKERNDARGFAQGQVAAKRKLNATPASDGLATRMALLRHMGFGV